MFILRYMVYNVNINLGCYIMNASVEKLSISDAKQIAKTLLNQFGNNLPTALDCLLQLTDRGIEFPTAVSLVMDHFNVSQDDLTSAYDELF